ncbi:hypothetical protein ACQCLI_22855 [Pseudomonas nitroreducens]|uniref:hypothetical protein n=1 Tax=Pseudomonas TaxID=286 RepID=UPI0012FD9F72|nr:hypothetical protein [Pseudomonas nitroreducens]
MKIVKFTIPFMVLLALSLQTASADTEEKHGENTHILNILKNQPEGARVYMLRRIEGESKKFSTFTLILNNGNYESYLNVRENSSGVEKNYKLNPGQVSNLKRFEASSQFWRLPEYAGENGLDGSKWQLEGAKLNEYHKTIRWSPLPPYYSGIMDKGGNVVKDPNTPPGSDVKQSDEVGLDMFCILIMLTQPNFSESLF